MSIFWTLGKGYPFFKFRNRINFVKISKNYFGQKDFYNLEPRFFSYKENNCYLEGHWQSEKYFENIKKTLSKDLKFNQTKLNSNIINLSKKF